MSTVCAVCGKPAGDAAYLCANDAAKLARSLLALGVPELDRNGQPMPTLIEELEAAVRRDVKFAGRIGSRSTTAPLPFGWNPADLMWALRNTLTTWARLVADERGVTPPTLDAERPAARWPGERTQSRAPNVQKPAQRCEHTDLPRAYCAHCNERKIAS